MNFKKKTYLQNKWIFWVKWIQDDPIIKELDWIYMKKKIRLNIKI